MGLASSPRHAIAAFTADSASFDVKARPPGPSRISSIVEKYTYRETVKTVIDENHLPELPELLQDIGLGERVAVRAQRANYDICLSIRPEIRGVINRMCFVPPCLMACHSIQKGVSLESAKLPNSPTNPIIPIYRSVENFLVTLQDGFEFSDMEYNS